LRNSLRKIIVLGTLLLSCAPLGAQTVVEPERTQLLNGLRILLLPRPGDQEVLLKLRIHSGAAFDLAGKEGSAALLGDLLFPDPTTREYFVEEMQGRLNVKTGYDSLTITMQGRAREFERMVEILRTALVSTELTNENLQKMRNGRIKVIRETAISPANVADRAIASRLFGDFPYGRPSGGSLESLERVQRSDLLFVRERFLNPNNATLFISGGVQPSRAMRALRQLLGVWRKSEQVVPSTFRQPTTPDTRTLIINSPGDQSIEVRFAARGLARKDPDFLAASLVASVARQRWENVLPELSRSPVFVRHDAFSMPGMFVMGTTIDHLLAGKALTSAQDILKSLVSNPITPAELEQARNETLAAITKELGNPDGMAETWLDVDTYGITSAVDQTGALKALTAADVQRTANRLFSTGGFASVVVGNSELVKSQIEQHSKVEIMGAIDPKPNPQPESNPNKTQTDRAAKPN
jgi:zinc protease